MRGSQEGGERKWKDLYFRRKGRGGRVEKRKEGQKSGKIKKKIFFLNGCVMWGRGKENEGGGDKR